ncbi:MULTISPECIES: AAA family ATPase [unclassified Mesorhizobium]|uniref:ATP-dependent nuclease n=1 Tax=unclassified Mesorhizobium TaxID=325217 RepID=UPI0003CF0E0D|nr:MULTISPECIES: AAA family ATPase [unclassified Mesorhizobium]ESY51336.1 ATPase [Mesorhizobium sp. LNJC374B00]ESY56708.1 ATPase [Mesorhizobium sp. LNJC372A00]WJI82004.1 AAA family ATPase [Mesorhizobium sp. C374B]WJI88523.1 AAA family ATPase [Mesorhizobium sp. C372A]
MKIEQLTIHNFRCFGPEGVTLTFEEAVTAFVGNNGSGKTAIFAAIQKTFGTSSAQRTIRKSDFHVPKDGEKLESETVMVIDCLLGFPELEEDDVDTDAIPEVFNQMATSGEEEPLKVRMRLEAKWIDDGTPEGTIEEAFRWVRATDDDFEWDECQAVQAVERNYIQLIYVPANRNAADQVTNLLKGRLWRAAKWSQQMIDQAETSAGALQNEFDTEEVTEFILERIETRWSEVYTGDTDTTPKLRLIEARLEELVRRAEFVFFPDEAGRERRLEDLSDGQRSLFHIALTAATLEIERDALQGAAADSVFDQEKLRRTYLTILAIEEPENSLSPFFLSRIMRQARDIGGATEAQVILSSHSASILGRVEPEEVRYARLDAETRVSSVKILTLPEEGTEARRYVRLAVRAYPELYFARFVVLAEGESEAIVLPAIAEASDFPLDRSFVPIVPLAGRFVAHFWRLLSDIEIPYATLLDLDAGRQHGGAKTVQYVVEQLAVIDNDLSTNKLVVDEEIDPDAIDEIDDQELLDQDQDHPWLMALRLEGVFFSSPLDIDFAMQQMFPGAYRKPRPGGRGPKTGAIALADKKKVTLKTEGNPDLYDHGWDAGFIWYPYLFLSESKPEAHLRALSEIEPGDLASSAPAELKSLVAYVKRRVSK